MSTTPTIDKKDSTDRLPVPQAYSTLEEEYDALTGGVGVVDRSDAGRLRVSGDDASDLLNRLTTNELMDLQPGTGVPTVLTSNKGRVLDLLYVFKQDDHLLVMTSGDARQKVIDWIDFYTIIEDVEVRDVTTETAMLSVVGPEAANLLGVLAGDMSSLAPYGSFRDWTVGLEAEAYRTDFLGLPTYDILVAAADRQQLWDLILETGQSMGVIPIGYQASEVVRIEQGVPSFGAELSEDFNPLEADLMDLISFTKGCYVGQEVIARLDTYKKVQKQLVRMRWSGDELVPNSKLTYEGNTSGVLTSVAAHPRLGSWIGLGYVKKALAASGTMLVAEDSEIAVEVVELPR